MSGIDQQRYFAAKPERDEALEREKEATGLTEVEAVCGIFCEMHLDATLADRNHTRCLLCELQKTLTAAEKQRDEALQKIETVAVHLGEANEERRALRDARDAAIKERDEARDEAARLREQLKPEMFWDADDPEQCHADPWAILEPYDRGTIVEIQRAARLSNVFGFIAEDNEFYFDTYAEADTELAKMRPEPVASEPTETK